MFLQVSYLLFIYLFFNKLNIFDILLFQEKLEVVDKFDLQEKELKDALSQKNLAMSEYNEITDK